MKLDAPQPLILQCAHGAAGLMCLQWGEGGLQRAVLVCCLPWPNSNKVHPLPLLCLLSLTPITALPHCPHSLSGLMDVSSRSEFSQS